MIVPNFPGKGRNRIAINKLEGDRFNEYERVMQDLIDYVNVIDPSGHVVYKANSPLSIVVSTLNISEANSTTDGYLSTGDWNAFNIAYNWGDWSTQGFITASSSDTLTNKSGYISQWANDSSYINLTNISTSVIGLTYTNTTGVLSTTSGYTIPTAIEESNWNTAYNWGDWSGQGFITEVAWSGITGTQSSIDISGFTNDSGYLTTESDDLDDVLTRGSTSASNNIVLTGGSLYAAKVYTGDGTDIDCYYYANNADAPKPSLRYSASGNKWQYSNNGTSFSDIGSGGAGGDSDSVTKEITQSGHGLSVTDVVYLDGTEYNKARANDADTSEAVGIIKEVTDVNTFTILTSGFFTDSGIAASGTNGDVAYVDPDSDGGIVYVQPASTDNIIKPIGHVTDEGILIDIMRGNEYEGDSVATDELIKVSSNDTTAGYLNGKLVAGSNITLTEGNDGGDETLTIASAGGEGVIQNILKNGSFELSDGSGDFEYWKESGGTCADYGSVDAIPTMTSDSAPSGDALADSVYTAGNEAFRAFDKSSVTNWATSVGGAGWLQYHFDTGETIDRYTLRESLGNPNAMPYNWTLEASNTGAWGGEEVTLDTQTTEVFSGKKKTYDFTNTTSYTYYRIVVTANVAGKLKIGEFELIEKVDSEEDSYGGDNAVVVTSTGTGSSITQVLSNLKPSTTYNVSGRVKVTAGDTAKLYTTGADTELDLSSTSTSWETVTGTFITDATPTDVALKLGSDTDGDVVYFDQIAVYELSAFVPAIIPERFLNANSDGIINMPKQSGCCASLGTNQLNIVNTTDTLIDLDTVVDDIQGEFNTSTHRFTTTEAGKYLVVGNIIWVENTLVADKTIYTRIRKNGSLIVHAINQIAVNASANPISSTATAILDLSAGDYVELSAFHTMGVNTPDIDGVALRRLTYMDIQKLA